MSIYGIGMGEAAVTALGAEYDTLVSGGAADCIIIAAYNPSLRRAFMVHAHRTTNLAQVIEKIETYVRANSNAATVIIELASTIFAFPPTGLVHDVNAALGATGYTVHAQNISRSLSLNAHGLFTAGADPQLADRKPGDSSNALGCVDLKMLSPIVAPTLTGRPQSQECPTPKRRAWS
jgi:hypothetical protein